MKTTNYDVKNTWPDHAAACWSEVQLSTYVQRHKAWRRKADKSWKAKIIISAWCLYSGEQQREAVGRTEIKSIFADTWAKSVALCLTKVCVDLYVIVKLL